ncbi:MAG: redox-regulated ATPase YchF [Actinomyces sp.]|nr:redox-regulated ATPase YchF [Actinomyces sp.]MCI1641713.1 redox-regulated ATPase YchF [Actinomyces sp.]MCI1661814.1 redox-regulated ATPase YchF [Actinomyces sp.]MCI1690656.1 redox-regulated ATPase YchF [Actinomyces sp.]MCI1786744.1 redox-regulated ATPase YchF [Actinomyces sp.]MCI1829114.1 redox-regulated ATPase YchF [Actinomyces sp.]
MSLTIGIAGLPNVGKSTLFNALTRATVLAANYPFATIEPNVGIVPLPDPRLERLASLYNSERIVPATVSFVDIAGIVRGASEGEGLGNQFLANIREADAICQVTRVFQDPDVVHVDGRVSPKDDIETISTELILADMQTLERQIPRLEKEVRGRKTEAVVLETAQAALALLERGELLSGTARAGLDAEALKSFQLMTSKPFIYVFNMDDAGMDDPALQTELRDLVAPAEAVFLNAEFEAELVELDPDDAREMLEESGQSESGLDKLARVGFDTLGLQTFLTAGPKEARAWTIHQGDTAPEAAGVIHTDFQKGFIKAEIVGFDDLMELGSVAEARAHGKVRMEGKDYVMQDGDVVEFRFNVSS